jgi:hypothetical protein
LHSATSGPSLRGNARPARIAPSVASSSASDWAFSTFFISNDARRHSQLEADPFQALQTAMKLLCIGLGYCRLTGTCDGVVLALGLGASALLSGLASAALSWCLGSALATFGAAAVVVGCAFAGLVLVLTV